MNDRARGNVSIIVVVFVVLAGAVTVGLARFGGTAIDRARADAAADAAALAAATQFARGASPTTACAAAERIAAANGARLLSCRCAGARAEVIVEFEGVGSQAAAVADP